MSDLVRKYGWKRDLPDHRDFLFKASGPVSVPRSMDLRSKCPPIYDQGQLGSCTANAITAAVQFNTMREGKADHSNPSRLFVYYNERAMEGTISQDAGAAIRDGIKSVATHGVCDESMWPYNIKMFAQQPPIGCYLTAKRQIATQYARVQSLNDMLTCLAQGFPFVFGFTVYQSFESQQVAQTGKMPMPSRRERVLGGHAVMAVGYDQSSQNMLVRNSWGTHWGIGGYFYMPFAYITNPNLSSDMWTIRQV